MFFIIHLLPFLVGGQTCLIDCRGDVDDLPTASTEIEAILEATIGFFSVDFDETCTLENAAGLVDSTAGTPGYYEFEVERAGVPTTVNTYHGECPVGLATAFGYLNELESGKISNGEYTYTCATTDFVPDGSYEPLAPVRDQRCVFGLRLTPTTMNKFGAAFWTRKQPVAYGFETSFRFRVLHRSKLCPLEQSPNRSRWCYERGGRGFAFIVQNEGSPGSNGIGDSIGFKVNSLGRVNLGYAFPRNLAIEFDYHFDTDSNDPSWNHIAVMVPVSRQPGEGDNANSADHETNMLAMADGVSLPPLSEGTHKVRIVYDVRDPDKWKSLIGEWYSRPLSEDQTSMLTYWSNNRLGVLSVFLDDRVVLKALVDLANVVQADPVSTYSASPSDEPNTSSPGSAWVGFVGATGSDNAGSPVILDWAFTSVDNCETGNAVCSVGSVVGDTVAPATRFTLRNTGRVDVQLFMSLDGVKSFQCQNGILRWDEIHPYFLGCSRDVEMGPGVQLVSITDTSNMRTVTITDPALIDRDFQGSVFVRRKIPEYCVIEHETDFYKLYFAQCDCEFCARVFDNQVLYSVFYSSICSERYTNQCVCLEVSQMAASTFATDFETRANPWVFITQDGYDFETKTMQHQKHSVCRGCKYDHHCSLMFKQATCDEPSREYRIGNPLRPTIEGGGFEDWNRGEDALDGLIKGNACNCKDRFAEFAYTNTLGVQQLFNVFLLATLQGSQADCQSCLRIEGASCLEFCSSPIGTNYLHWPSGQSCGTCTLASASWVDLTGSRRGRLRACVYSSIEDGDDPWTNCLETVREFSVDNPDDALVQIRLRTYLNGIATHYLAECPGRDFDDYGAVCAPNLLISDSIPMQAIARESALAANSASYFPAWWEGVSCLNAMCELVAPSACYTKLFKIIFTQDDDGVTLCTDVLGSGTGCFLVNGPEFDADTNAVVMDREIQSYGYTSALDRSLWTSAYGGLTAKSLEVWASIATVDTITDLIFANPGGVSASSTWGDDYSPALAVDGDLETFWQSPTSAAAAFEAVWEIDFEGDVQNAEGYVIYWAYRALDFSVQVSIDGGVSWSVVDEFEDFADDAATVSTSFFQFSSFRIVMTLASTQRPPGQDEDLFAYGIYEIEIYSDSDLARLKPAEVVLLWAYPADLAFDSDLTSWWSTEKGVDTGVVQAVLAAPVTDACLVRVIFRRGYPARAFDLYLTVNGEDWAELTCTGVLGCETAGEGSDFLNSFSLAASLPDLTGVRVHVTEGSAYYDESIVQISEIELYQKSTSLVTVSPTSCILLSGGPCPAAVAGLRTLPPSAIAQYTVWTTTDLIPEGETLGILTITFSDSTNIASSITIISPSTTTTLSSAVGIGQTNSFAVLVNDVTDITVMLAARAGGPTVVNAIHLSPMKRVDLSTETISADSEWQRVDAVDAAVQGLPSNLIDGDLSTEFRTKLGAPSITDTISIDLDYQLDLVLHRHISIDAIFVRFSYVSQWFRLTGVSPIGAVENTQCEWTPSDVSETTSCASKISQLRPAPYDFVHSSASFGASYFSTVSLTLMQSSAADFIHGETIMGVREVELFQAYPRIAPLSISLANNTGAGFLIDSNFTNSWGRTGSDGVEFLIDLAADPVWVKQVEVWWGALTSVPGSATLSVSTTNTACASATFSILSTQSVTPSLSIPLQFSAFPNPIKCAKLSFPSTAPTSRNYNVTEIFFTAPEPSRFATIVDSSFGTPEYMLDGLAETSSVASLDTGGPDHYLFLTLPTVGLSVWGVSIETTGSIANLDLNSLRLYYCADGLSLAACKDQGLWVSIPGARRSRFLFLPLACDACRRVAVTMSGSGVGTLVDVVDVKIFAGPNEALSLTTVSFDDDRAWDYVVAQAVDGDEATAWISEPDVSRAELKLALINNGNGFEALDPAYAATAASRLPVQVAELALSFRFPISDFTIEYGLDGQDWSLLHTYVGEAISELVLTEFFLANFLKLSLTKPHPDQTITTIAVESVLDTVWHSPIFGIDSIVATTLSSLSRGKSVVATSTAVSADYAVDGSEAWVSYPPLKTAVYSLASSQTVSGVLLTWLVPPVAYTVEYQVGPASFVTATMLTDPATVSPELIQFSLAGRTAVTAVRLSVTSYGSRDSVDLAALGSFKLFEPNAAGLITPTSVTADASDESYQYLTDGGYVGSHYASPSGMSDPTITFTLPALSVVGEIVIYWDDLCSGFLVEGKATVGGSWFTVYTTSTNADAVSTMLVLLEVSQLKFTLQTNANSELTSFTVFEIEVFSANQVVAGVSQALGVGETAVSFAPASAVDTNESSQVTQWMSAAGSAASSLTIDLGNIYRVSEISVLWGFTPWAASPTRLQIDAQRVWEISDDDSAYQDVTSGFSYSAKVDSSSDLLAFRYLRVTISAAYAHAALGVSIRDIDVVWDQNLGRIAVDKVVLQNGWWDFPPAFAADGDTSSGWLSKRGESTSELVVDLGEIFDLAGIEVDFRFKAGTIEFSYSTDCDTYLPVHTITDNTDAQVVWSGQDYQFRGQCVKAAFSDPLTTIEDPDHPPSLKKIFGVFRFSVFHHVGGGGVFGIEAKVDGAWGSVFDTISFAPFQPNQWHLLSNQQARSENVDGEFVQQETGMVHLVATFSDTTITLYRNGVQYGSAYPAVSIPWDTFDDVRLVFGVRSSAFVGATENEQTILMGSDLPEKQVSTLSPFFSGSIQSVALFTLELLPEEVMGLYESASGSRERGCLCHDACPSGSNRHYPDALVPCSGQGVCRRQYDANTGLADGGYCQCSPGFSGLACETHCSVNGGCCSVDDDCPSYKTCDSITNSCTD